jgi:drug/metabolite transporter (DMT)-like permease
VRTRGPFVSSAGPSPSERDSRTVRAAFVALVTGAAAIAFAPIFVRLSELGPTATAFYRLCLALPLLWLWAGGQGRGGRQGTRRSTSRRDALHLVLAGLLFAVDLGVWHWSIYFTSVANATLLANFAPILVTLGAWVLFGERVTGTFILALGLGTAGIVVLMWDSVDLGERRLLGDGLGLLTAVFYGAYILSVSRLRRRFSTATIMAWSGTVTCLAVFPVALLSGESLLSTTLYGWVVLLALAWFSHASGQGLIAYALAHLPAAFSSLSLLLQPVIAALLAWVLLAEPLRPMQAAGGAIVVAAIALVRLGSR